MQTIKIPIHAGWMKDLPKDEVLKQGGLVTAKNVIPSRGVYYPIGAASNFNSTATDSIILGGITSQDSSGQFYNYLGTQNRLYRFDATNMTNISRASGGDYAATQWYFVEYGDWVIATNFADTPQVIKGHDESNFAALGGSPPEAKFALMNSGHLILAYLKSGATTYPKKIQWSAREDVEDWTQSLTTGSDSQDFPEILGNITGIGSIGDAFVIAAEDSLTIGYYSGGIYTYNFKVNAIKGIGCYYPGSFISLGNKVFFWSKESIWSWDMISEPIEIGKNIRHTVLIDDVLKIYGDRVTACHDKENGLVLWSYPDSTSTGSATHLLVYNYLEDKFTNVVMACDSIFMGATGGTLLDSLTTTLIDDNTLPLIDSNFWLSKDLQPIIASTDYKVNTLTGTNLEAELETGEFNDIPNIITITKAYLPIDGIGNIGHATIKHRKSISDDQITSTLSTVKSDGSVDLRSSNRYLTLNFTASTFSYINKEIVAEGNFAGRR